MMTKKDILVRMAVELGVADYPDSTSNEPTLPADQATLRRLRNAFEDGRKAFYAEDPKLRLNRWEEVITLDPDATDPGVVILRSGVVAPPLGELTFEYPSGESGSGGRVEVTSWSRVNTLRADSTDATGAPSLIAFWQQGPASAGEARAWEARVYPTPHLAFVLRGIFSHETVELLDDTDVEPSGYPLAVQAFAIYEVQRANPIATGPTFAAAQLNRGEWMERVRRQERAKGPRNLGRTVGASWNRRTGRSFVPRIPVTLQDGTLLSDTVR
jgi:hypothetical protein